MYNMIFLVFLAAGVVAQTSLQVIANGSLPDGSKAVAAGAGQGSNVKGDAIVELNETTSRSTVMLSATGSSSSPQASAEVAPTPVPIEYTTVKPAPTPVTYLKQMKEVKPDVKCADIKDNMCPAISEFENCGYCILQKYPLVGYGCEIEKYLAKKDGTKGEYEVISKPTCECPEGALYIEDSTYCPTCNLVLAELAACAGVIGAPKDLSTIEIPASCLEKVAVPVEYLVECGLIKPVASPVVVVVDPKVEKDSKKYTTVKPIVEDTKKYTVVQPINQYPKEYVVVQPASSEASSSSKAPKSVQASASASASAVIGK
eukprot:TRINITY_DN9755_c1_g2_i2.p1 TRINITY_DN9755_c1_g2~~TRINITY_DN9755_c1_g2_i2.p1  ORF type:complete len:316 (-),score=50.00 TRINITY_DN9755_c1_g2_i2:298-1245(-)